MSVTDDQVAALRAQLAGNYDEHRRLLADLNARGALAGYTGLITATFIEAVDRRFGPGRQGDGDVIEFIGDVRARFPGADDEIDPVAAERIVNKALGRGSISDISGPAIRHIERLLLPVLVADEHLDDDELDRLLASARKLLDS